MSRRLPELLALLCAAGLALHALWRWPLYVAEMWTWRATSMDYDGLVLAVARDKHPPLQPLLAWALRQVHEAEWFLRLPSALGAVAAVVVLGLCVRRVLGEGKDTPGFAALGMLVLSLVPLWLAHAGIMRPYALGAAVGAGLVHGALRAPEAPRSAALQLGLLGVVGLYLHYVSGAVLGAAWLGAGLGLALSGREDRWRQLALLAAVGLLVLLALAPWMAWAGSAHLGKTRWGAPSPVVLRYLLFEADDLGNAGMHGVVLLAALGLLASLAGRRWVLVGLGVGALAFPLLMSASFEVRVRTYALLGLAPVVVLLAVVGAARLWRRPGAWALLALLGLGPGALELLSLPSNPSGRPEDAADDGVHDARRDMRLLSSLVPPGQRLVIPLVLEPDIYGHYAPDAVLLGPHEPGEPGDWRFLSGGGRQHEPPPEGARGCRLEHAFAMTLDLPDDAACERVLGALAEGPHRPWQLELAQHAEDDTAREAHLRAALGGSSPEAHLALHRLLLDQGRGQEAREIARDGVRLALSRRDRFPAALLLEEQGRWLEEQGEAEAAASARASAACLQRATEEVWLPQRCLLPLLRDTVQPKDLGSPAGPPRERRRRRTPPP